MSLLRSLQQIWESSSTTNPKEAWKIYSVWSVTQRHLQKNCAHRVCCFFLVSKITFLCQSKFEAVFDTFPPEIWAVRPKTGIKYILHCNKTSILTSHSFSCLRKKIYGTKFIPATDDVVDVAYTIKYKFSREERLFVSCCLITAETVNLQNSQFRCEGLFSA